MAEWWSSYVQSLLAPKDGGCCGMPALCSVAIMWMQLLPLATVANVPETLLISFKIHRLSQHLWSTDNHAL